MAPIHRVLALQQAAGNQATMAALAHTRVLQRADPEEDTAAESELWSELAADFFAYSGSMAATNVRYPTVTRENWNAAFSKLWSEIGDPGERTDEQLRETQKAFERLQDLFDDLNTEANELWVAVDAQCQAELLDLAGSSLLEDTAAAEVLSELYAKTYQRVEMTGDHFVPEDLVALHHMLENATHIAQGQARAKRDLERRARLEEEFADEGGPVEDPSVAAMAWDIVGWDSARDFAADVALTIVSGGIGKVAKVVVKSHKARKRLDKLQKLSKLRSARKAKRAKKLASGVSHLLKGVKEVLDGGAADHVAWIKKNWKNTGRAYLTDELGEAGGTGDPGEAKTVLERYSKDRIADYVSSSLGLSSSEEREQFRVAVFAYAVGMDGQGKDELRRYFQMNLKRRGLSNAVYYAVRTGVLETKLSSAVIVDLAASVAGEMAQDLVVNITGAGGASTTVVEAARKSVQVTVANWLKDSLG